MVVVVVGFKSMSAPHSHVEQHEHVDGDADDEGLVRNVEGEVGDQHEEEGGYDGGDDSALNPPKIRKKKTRKKGKKTRLARWISNSRLE